MNTSVRIREYVAGRGYPRHVVDGGVEYLLTAWERHSAAASAERQDVRPRHAMPRAHALFMTVALVVLTSCGFVPERVSWIDPRLSPMLEAIAAVDRAALGLSPIDRTSSVRLENRPTARYDAMLHVDGQTSRTIAFRKTTNGYRWIHEQETYTGPKSYSGVDGTFHEQIVVTYGTEPVSGHTANTLHVEYWGEDPRLPAHEPLTLEQVRPIIAEWNRTR